MKLSTKLIRDLKPKTYYDELAEYGVLDEYLRTYFPDKYENDKGFRQEMFERLMKHSKTSVPGIERFYLEKLCESLEFFMEYNRQWMK
jgi:hypothetical protein